jgi:hypothetical protein
MKFIKSSYIFLIMGLLFLALSCKDEDTDPFLEPETAVHGWGRVAAGSPADFVFQGEEALNIAFQWNSIEGVNTASKIEFYAFFNEAYKDNEGNNRTAQHGGDYFDYNTQRGILFKTLESNGIPGNRQDVTFTVTQNDIYQLYKDATFNYGNGSVKVFENPAKPDRSPTSPFVAGDKFRIGWIIYTADGRKFDAWSPSICAEEFPNSSCYV